MKYEDYLAQIEQDPEYIEGKEALLLRFALGDTVLFTRIKRGWSQTELAWRVGTKQANISNIESCLANPTLDLIKRVADALELDVSFAPSVAALSPTSKAVFLAGIGTFVLVGLVMLPALSKV